MKRTISKTLSVSLIALSFPLMLSCSVLSGGGSVSGDPEVRAQQEEVNRLKQEHRETERRAEEASQREKAAKNRLKAAEHELKALEEQAKRRNSN